MNSLIKLLLDSLECATTRLAALDDLWRTNTPLPARCVERLDIGDLLWHNREDQPPRSRYLALLEAYPVAARRQILLERTRVVDRVLSLVQCLELQRPNLQPLVELLYEQWLLRDRAEMEVLNVAARYIGDAHANVRVASLTRDREPSAALLEEYRRWPSQRVHRWAGTRLLRDKNAWSLVCPSLWASEAELIAAVRAAPDDFRGRAKAFDLPYGALVVFYSPEELWERIERELRRIAVLHAGPRPPDSCAIHRLECRLIAVVETWPQQAPEIGDRLASLAACPDTYVGLRRRLQDLYYRKWRTDVA